jgi:hypothetical protein
MMKSHPWDELNDNAKDFFDSVGAMPEPEVEEDINDKRLQRRRLTELRRRAEERLDWKRTFGDLQFDELDLFDELDGDRSFGRPWRFDNSSDPDEFDEH